MVSTAFTGNEESRMLLSHTLFHTHDVGEACKRVAEVFSPHKLRIAKSDTSINTRMCHVPLNGISLNRLSYGATVDIDAGCLNNFYIVQMPLTGVSEVSWGRETIHSDSHVASVISPTHALRMNTQKGCDKIIIKINRALLERHCEQHLGHAFSRPVEFKLDMELVSSQVESWRRLIDMLIVESDRDENMLKSPIVRVHFEQALVSALLFGQPNNYTDELQQPVRPIAPHYVKRAEAYILDHVAEAFSMVDLAQHVGVSTRALNQGFKNFRNVSPLAFLKSVRLERVRAELKTASPDRPTVTEIAMRWGFTHLGRFTADYRSRYGELPSETLRYS